MSHYEERLERDLNRIRAEVSKLAQLVEVAVRNSVHALLTGNEAVASATILADGHINRAMRHIDSLCHSFVAVHLPSAGHLRLVSSVLRTNILLERIGDYAVTICREASQLSAIPQASIARGVEVLANDVKHMLHQAVVAFETGNAELARGTMAMAGQAQDTFIALFDDLLDGEASCSLRDRFAIFVVLHRLERMSDQAKNLCEETVFAVTGEAKVAKVYRILFLDEDNCGLSLMAEGIAKKNFSDSGDYSSAGRTAGNEANVAMRDFMASRGVDLGDVVPGRLDLTPAELAEFHVIISLQGPVKSYVEAIPFHTVGLSWDVGEPCAAPGSDVACEESHRKLAVLIRDLMVELRGEDAS